MNEKFTVQIIGENGTARNIIFNGECDKSTAARIAHIATGSSLEMPVGMCDECDADVYATDLDVSEEFLHDVSVAG